MWALSAAHSSCVMQRRSSLQFSRPPHCVASIGSSTATMMSATETCSARLARGCSRRPGRARCRPGRGGAACRTVARGRTARSSGARDTAASVTGPVAAVHRDVDHRRDGKPSFGGQSHVRSSLSIVAVGPPTDRRRARICPGQTGNFPIPEQFSQLKAREVHSSILLIWLRDRSASAVAFASPHSTPSRCSWATSRFMRSSVAARGRGACGSPGPRVVHVRRDRVGREADLGGLRLAPLPGPRP